MPEITRIAVPVESMVQDAQDVSATIDVDMENMKVLAADKDWCDEMQRRDDEAQAKQVRPEPVSRFVMALKKISDDCEAARRKAGAA